MVILKHRFQALQINTISNSDPTFQKKKPGSDPRKKNIQDPAKPPDPKPWSYVRNNDIKELYCMF